MTGDKKGKGKGGVA